MLATAVSGDVTASSNIASAMPPSTLARVFCGIFSGFLKIY